MKKEGEKKRRQDEGKGRKENWKSDQATCAQLLPANTPTTPTDQWTDGSQIDTKYAPEILHTAQSKETGYKATNDHVKIEVKANVGTNEQRAAKKESLDPSTW